VVWLSASDQLGLIRSGDASPEELRDLGVGRCELLNPAIGFLASTLYERAPAGVPMLLKDAGQEMAGASHWAGLSSLRDAGHRSTVTTSLVERFEGSGFSIIGKSTCPPLANGVTTEPPGFPPTRNPWDLTRSAGGSSGGAAAAVACGVVPVAHGSDKTGSLRFPAALCGLVTLVPTARTVDGVPPCGEPANAAWRDFVLARDARDLALAFEVLARPVRPTSRRSVWRVGLLDHDPELGFPVDPACARAVGVVGDLLEQLGCVVDIDWPETLDTLWRRIGGALRIIFDATRQPVLRWVEARLGRPAQIGDVPDEVFEAIARDGTRDANDRARAQALVDESVRPIINWWDDHDLLVTPATFQTGWPLGGRPGLRECGTLAAPFSHTGQPSLVVPIHGDEGTNPVGVQLIGRHGSDDDLLHLAETLQTHLQWTTRKPPNFAD
jgi:amidase